MATKITYSTIDPSTITCFAFPTEDGGIGFIRRRDGKMTVCPDSSAIKLIEYDQDADTMLITFTSGSLYRYKGVNRKIVEAFVDAPSIGRHFAKYIRGHYDYEKVA